jgi:heme/copper-type cytochrome/quinol oxidase subunit 2
MSLSRRTLGVLLVGTGACLLAGSAVVRLFAHPLAGAGSALAALQDQAPNRRAFTVVAREYRFSPNRLEVTQNDLVKLTIHSEDVAYSLTIDEYRVSRRVPAGGATTLEFRADRTGTFSFYSNLTSDTRHAEMRGELVVRAR